MSSPPRSTLARWSRSIRSSTAIVGTKYTILTATGGVTGIFADPDVFFGRYEGMLSYDADDVFMTVQNGALVPLLPPNPPQNVLNVANAIDTAIQNGVTPPPGFQNLFNYTPAQLENALAQLEGQQAADAGQGAFQLMTDFLDLLLDPTAGGGGGRRQWSAAIRAGRPGKPAARDRGSLQSRAQKRAAGAGSIVRSALDRLGLGVRRL